jgi:hypothetical protein
MEQQSAVRAQPSPMRTQGTRPTAPAPPLARVPTSGQVSQGTRPIPNAQARQASLIIWSNHSFSITSEGISFGEASAGFGKASTGFGEASASVYKASTSVFTVGEASTGFGEASYSTVVLVAKDWSSSNGPGRMFYCFFL